MYTKLKPILIVSFILVCNIAFAQSKKLVKSFKLGAISYQLYESFKTSKSDQDTVFYLLQRLGKAKIIAKEIKAVIEKKQGDTLAASTYKINKSSFVFYRSEGNKFYHRIYTLQKTGLLSYKSSLIPKVKEPSAPTMPLPVAAPDYDHSGHPTSVDIMPEFPGGMNALRKFISNNLHYPYEAQENEVSGTVYAKFVITKDGSIANIEIERKLGFGCDQEVIRILKRMPKWSPGKLKGQAVNYLYRLPVIFSLQ
ncbi:energy transducer TonB [Pedobacter agri]|uniref:energy transducer TonB n=1 Tax=Pedobacter agri TaxID=454586 RepID=UPI002931AFB3|nr:energy transducer TonB [Pedobacter agri]